MRRDAHFAVATPAHDVFGQSALPLIGYVRSKCALAATEAFILLALGASRA
jgi:hypothetical protein